MSEEINEEIREEAAPAEEIEAAADDLSNIENEEQTVTEEAAGSLEDAGSPSDASGAYRSPEDEEFAAKIAARRKAIHRKYLRRRNMTRIIICLVFVGLVIMYGREIFRLKAENIKLKQQQQELIEERDRLEKELEQVDDPEYIKDQARKQLKLLDPGEIMFLFGDEEETQEDSDAEN